MLTKKGVDFGVFKWILATAAGVFIFLFFYGLSTSHISTSTLLKDNKYLLSFDDQLDALGVSESSITTIALDETLQASCGNVGRGSSFHDTHNIFFAPPTLKGPTITLWTREWNFPYPAAVFSYASSAQPSFLLYDDSAADFAASLDIPSSFPIITMPLRSLDLQHILSARYPGSPTVAATVSTSDQQLSLPQQLQTASIHRLHINIDKHTISDLTMHTSSFYLGDDMFYGALLAPASYECLKERAIQQLHRITQIQEQRAAFLSSKLPACRDAFLNYRASLTSFLEAQTVEEYYNSKSNVEQHQSLLEQSSCLA